MKAKLGIAPIAWWNDDLEELSDDVSLEECLRQASEAGFTGMETGRRFPMDAKVPGTWGCSRRSTRPVLFTASAPAPFRATVPSPLPRSPSFQRTRSKSTPE